MLPRDFSRFWVLLFGIFAVVLAGCGPGAGPLAAVPATPRGPATGTDGSPATPTATPAPTSNADPGADSDGYPHGNAHHPPVPTETPTPVPAPTNTPTLPTSTPTPPSTPTPAPIQTPSVGVDMAVQKAAQCNQASGACTFSITVVNNGPGPYTGGVPTQDVISPAVPFTITAFGGDGGTICYTSGSAVNCGPHYPVTLPPGGA